MKIGFARYSQACDIDFYNASAKLLGCELRVGLLEALVQLGHEVVILSKVPDNQTWLFEHPELHPIYNYQWMDHVEYSPVEIPDDLDLFVVENSTTNALYGGDNLLRTRDLLQGIHDTRCVVYQHGDISDAIAVPFNRIFDAVADPSLAPENLKNVFAGTQLNGNTWAIWSHANNETMILGSKGNNVSYGNWTKKHVGFPLGYSQNFDRPLVDIHENDKVDLVYIGGEKSALRSERLLELAGTGPCCSRIMFGRWQHPPDGWYYAGPVEGHGRAYAFLPLGKATICVSDKWMYKSGQLTSRISMGIAAGVATFADKNWSNLDSMLGPAAQIESHEQIHEYLPHWRDIVAMQQERLQPWHQIYSTVLHDTVS